MTAVGAEVAQPRDWIGRESRAEGPVPPELVATLSDLVQPRGATGSPAVGQPLGLHWCLALAEAPLEALGPDGHVRRGGFLPPVALPRRMWAGGDVEFHGEFTVGRPVERRSRIADVTSKTGKSGDMVFVSVEHVYRQGAEPIVSERQDIVYLGIGTGPTIARAHADPEAIRRRWRFLPSSVTLFRYSAITWNSHRIHYHADYARDVEGYPGLVVHGPMQASLILNCAAADMGKRPVGFRFRARAPAFAGDELFVGLGEVRGGEQTAWSIEVGGGVAMDATVRW